MAQAAIASTEQYNYDIVRKFTIMALVWGLLGMTVGVYIASELAWPFLNFDIPEITFGRLRPVHTTLVIFGFGGSALFLSPRDTQLGRGEPLEDSAKVISSMVDCELSARKWVCASSSFLSATVNPRFASYQAAVAGGSLTLIAKCSSFIG